MLQSFILASLIVGAYGSLYTIPNSTLQLGLIDPITGQVTSFGPSYDNYDITPQLTAIDLVHDLFYTIVYEPTSNITYLIGLHIRTGVLKYQIELPFTPLEFVGVGQGLDVDLFTGHVYCFGQKGGVGLHTLLRVIPSKNEIETIMTFDGVDLLGATSALDPLHKIYWVEVYSLNTSYSMFYGINVESKTVAKVPNSNYSLQTLAWDPITKLMVGFGIMEQNISLCTVVTLDSKTGQFNQIAVLEEYEIVYDSDSTIDWKNRVLYAMIQPLGNLTTPYQLVGFNLESKEIVSSPNLCVVDCPYSLEFLNRIWF